MEKSTLIRDYQNLQYFNGFGNHIESEFKKDALPKIQNTPKKVPYGLYTEQLSGTPFTLPRHKNQRSWLYKVQPSVTQGILKPVEEKKYSHITTDFNNKKNYKIIPTQLRWRPLDQSSNKNFLEGLTTYCGAGNPETKNGMNIYGYCCDKSMEKIAFYNSDGDLLIVPQIGNLYLITEFGKMVVEPRSFVVIPRGIKFCVEVEGMSRGWMGEVYNGHFQIPDLGPIGSNGLANPRDFEVPQAFAEIKKENWIIVNKFIGEFFEAECDHSPFDVVAYHGNYYPYKYNLNKFNVVNSVSFDHLDPSIFTVLTCQSNEPGNAICDFVVFKERWMVAENTFRPPYYHRNLMSEFMGNIEGVYDAKGKGFEPGCSSLHLPMTAHGPDQKSYEKGINEKDEPVKYPDTMSFMFESCLMFKIAQSAFDKAISLDKDYNKCWSGLKDYYSESK